MNDTSNQQRSRESMLDLTVVVPTHNRLGFLPALLDSLEAQDYPSDRWELVLVDDGSSDDTAIYLRSRAEQYRNNMIVLCRSQSGAAAARNKGARTARGRAVLFLDDDMIASPTLVREHAQVHLQDARAVVAGHVSSPVGEREPWVAWEDAQLHHHFAALKSGVRIPGPRDFYTGNCSVSTSLFEQVGGFDATLPRAEDVEIGYRLAGAGARFYFRAGADSLHLGRHFFAGWLRNARLYGRCDVMLAWEKGHSHLRAELFKWYHKRNSLNKALVRVCAAWPALEGVAIHSLHISGYAAYKARARGFSNICYSAIYNLAYWLALMQRIGKEQFWSGINAQAIEVERLDNKALGGGLKDKQARL